MWRITRPDAVAILDDGFAKKSLNRYFAVLQYEKPSNFVIAKKLSSEVNNTDSLEKMWAEHANSIEAFRSLQREVDEGKKLNELPVPAKSFLDLKIAIATHIAQRCHFCNRKCGVNRLTSNLGYCGCGNTMTVPSIFAHMGEEPELVPSGTIFTMGCTIRCRHCQNWTISQWKEEGTKYEPDQLAREVDQLRRSGCRNANLVGGEPTPWLKQWLQTFNYVKVNVPIVWNSNSYYSEETSKLLAGFVDVYLLDFKYGPGDCAKRISDAPEYWQVCTRNHLEAKVNGELIIRVLVLPGHLECCTSPILRWIAEKIGTETRVNLLFRYHPDWQAHEIPELRRKLSRGEIEIALQMAKDSGLKNVIT